MLLKQKKNLSIQIPKGVDDGTQIRLSGKGDAGYRGGSNGDLYVFITVEKHKIFQRSEENLYYKLPKSTNTAAFSRVNNFETSSIGVPNLTIG